MLNVLNAGKVLGTLENYFDMLTKTGYVKGSVTCRFLLYLFLYDFVDTMYDFLSDEDYDKINKLLNATFSGAGCLLPYHNSGGNGIKIGTQRYFLSDMGYLKISNLLGNSFPGGGHAWPYNDTSTDDITVGTQRYEGRRTRRITEQALGSKQRVTEDLNPRTPA